ncbi:MAG: PHP domain-containing protein [Eubacterium sp.]|nr:PHP domain-containing protein [Eubacterium sp.]
MNDPRLIDMHVHSRASDGTFAPDALAGEAKKAGLAAIALTDHDTMDGVPSAKAAADALGIELVPGIELSTTYHGCEVHVLGYYLSPEHPPLKKKLQEFLDFRTARNERMTQKLREEGFSLSMRQIREHFPDSILTRAHIARFLYETGQIPDIRTAFTQYIGEHCRCYIERPKISPVEAVRLIQNAGGLAVLAHPVLCGFPEPVFKQLIQEMKNAGMCGMEAVYSENSPRDERRMRQIADAFGLLVSGGSDFHGANKPQIHLGIGKGNLRIPYAFLQSFKDLRENQKNTNTR